MYLMDLSPCAEQNLLYCEFIFSIQTKANVIKTERNKTSKVVDVVTNFIFITIKKNYV